MVTTSPMRRRPGVWRRARRCSLAVAADQFTSLGAQRRARGGSSTSSRAHRAHLLGPAGVRGPQGFRKPAKAPSARSAAPSCSLCSVSRDGQVCPRHPDLVRYDPRSRQPARLPHVHQRIAVGYCEVRADRYGTAGITGLVRLGHWTVAATESTRFPSTHNIGCLAATARPQRWRSPSTVLQSSTPPTHRSVESNWTGLGSGTHSHPTHFSRARTLQTSPPWRQPSSGRRCATWRSSLTSSFATRCC